MTPHFDLFFRTFVENYNRQKVADKFFEELSIFPKSPHKIVNLWIEKELMYLIQRAKTGLLDPNSLTYPHPPIYRKDYGKYKEDFDNAARYIQSIALRFIDENPYKLSSGV